MLEERSTIASKKMKGRSDIVSTLAQEQQIGEQI